MPRLGGGKPVYEVVEFLVVVCGRHATSLVTATRQEIENSDSDCDGEKLQERSATRHHLSNRKPAHLRVGRLPAFGVRFRRR